MGIGNQTQTSRCMVAIAPKPPSTHFFHIPLFVHWQNRARKWKLSGTGKCGITPSTSNQWWTSISPSFISANQQTELEAEISGLPPQQEGDNNHVSRKGENKGRKVAYFKISPFILQQARESSALSVGLIWQVCTAIGPTFIDLSDYYIRNSFKI